MAPDGRLVAFDGCVDEPGGRVVLREAKGKGYERLLKMDPLKYPGKGVRAGLAEQAERHKRAAPGVPLEWHTAEEGAAAPLRSVVNAPGGGVIVVHFTPPMP